jgi:hypothetical protein
LIAVAVDVHAVKKRLRLPRHLIDAFHSMTSATFALAEIKAVKSERLSMTPLVDIRPQRGHSRVARFGYVGRRSTYLTDLIE